MILFRYKSFANRSSHGTSSFRSSDVSSYCEKVVGGPVILYVSLNTRWVGGIVSFCYIFKCRGSPFVTLDEVSSPFVHVVSAATGPQLLKICHFHFLVNKWFSSERLKFPLPNPRVQPFKPSHTYNKMGARVKRMLCSNHHHSLIRPSISHSNTTLESPLVGLNFLVAKVCSRRRVPFMVRDSFVGTLISEGESVSHKWLSDIP